MRRALIAVLTILAASLAVGTGAASAAPVLSFTEAEHQEGTINRGDERVTYAVKLRNVGDAKTAGSTSVALALPAGMKLGVGVGGAASSQWTCHLSASVCTNSGEIGPGAEFPTLMLTAWNYPDAPNTPTATFTAYGGGAGQDTVVQDSFTFAPAKIFQIENLAAVARDEAGAEFVVAGGHPFDATSSLTIPTHTASIPPDAELYSGLEPVEHLRDLSFELPAGFIGNLTSVPVNCTVLDVKNDKCPATAAVGGVDIESAGDFTKPAPLYRVIAEDGYVAAFALKPVPLSGVTYVLRAKVRSNGDYGVTAMSPLAPQGPLFLALKFGTLCSYGAKIISPGLGLEFDGCKKASEVAPDLVPFLTNPTRCAGDAPVTGAAADTWQNPGSLDEDGFAPAGDPAWKRASVSAAPTVGCEALNEAWTGVSEPSFTFRPDSTRAAAPAAYTAHLHIPQTGLSEADGLATAHLKDTTVTLPEGIALNPSAADGLGACTLEQAGYLGNDFPAPNPIRFRTNAPSCPNNSKVGTAEVTTPVLEDPLPGSVYLAAQDANPFGSRFAIYLVIDDKKTGTKATIPGRVSPDPQSGRVTTVFQNNPQAPIEDVELEIFGGNRASLVNPDRCGAYTTTTAFSPWSANNPDAPLPTELATPTDTVQIDGAPAGQPACAGSKAARPFAPGFDAGSVSLGAGRHTAFTVRITRAEGEQELSGVTVTSPPGFAATLKGVATCSEAAVEAARGRTGKAEVADPSCPASSQVGTTTVGAGAGPSPFYVKTGKAYLTGPYKGAPLSFTFVVPAVAGPFDLGVQVVRTALQLNPKTAQVTAVSDPLPQILDGVPLQVRDIRVEIDRPGFALNPTSCAAMAVSGTIEGGSGARADVSNRFQVGDCDKLGFKPKLKLALHGDTRRAAYQRLEATVTARPGDANIARAAVTLPHSAFLAQEHIRTICTRVQFAAHTCPKGSIYGRATAVTPLLDEPLSGPVYLRSSDNPLPDVVVALRGPDSRPIEVELAGRTDSVNGGIRNTFDIVPDAPVSRFTLRLFGGKKSLIVNSRDLCKGTQRATVRMGAQNGLERNFRPVVGNDCKKGKATGGKADKRSRPAVRAMADLLRRLF
jgi:hypothetical protein